LQDQHVERHGHRRHADQHAGKADPLPPGADHGRRGVRRMIRLVREASGRDVEILITDAEVVIVLPRAKSPSATPSGG
jgi:hypothetical protein